jgi:hypothetical protein
VVQKTAFSTGILVLASFALAPIARAQADEVDGIDGAYLDAPYTELVHPIDTDSLPDLSFTFDGLFSLLPNPSLTSSRNPSRSDTETTVSFQTPVESQASRGTCTFFSTTGVLEASLIRYKNASKDLRLSQQWLAYVISRTKTEDGSHSNDNFNSLAYYGTVEQSLMPYEGDEWKSASDNATSQARCGSVPSGDLKSCLISHYDPRLLTEADTALKANDPAFYAIRNRARAFRTEYLASSLDWHPQHYEVRTTGDIKTLLNQNIPLTLDVTFFYGAWNHGLAGQFGIERDQDHWDKGLIGYPAKGSVDRVNSLKHGAAHSVVIVGYDDDLEVQTQVKMTNGTTQTFTYRGVYFIKNSWGTTSFGAHAEIGGVSHPGYGMITQQYANEYGSFYRLPIQ